MTKVEYFERKEVNTKRATAEVMGQKVFFNIGSEKIRAMVEIIELVMTPIPVHAGLLRTCIVSCSMVSIGVIGYSLQNDLDLIRKPGKGGRMREKRRREKEE